MTSSCSCRPSESLMFSSLSTFGGCQYQTCHSLKADGSLPRIPRLGAPTPGHLAHAECHPKKPSHQTIRTINKTLLSTSLRCSNICRCEEVSKPESAASHSDVPTTALSRSRPRPECSTNQNWINFCPSMNSLQCVPREQDFPTTGREHLERSSPTHHSSRQGFY